LCLGDDCCGLGVQHQTAIPKGKPKNINVGTYQQVVERFSNDVKRIKKASIGGPKLNLALSIAPSKSLLCKVQRTSQDSGDCNYGYPQAQYQARVVFQGNNFQGKQGGGSG
jgi:hypothetical protein